MPDTLDGLIARIQKEGIEKAEGEAAKRMAAAEKKAADIVAAAEKKAAAAVERGEQEARDFEKRARQSLSQAARDSLLTLSKAIDTLFEELAGRVVRRALDPDSLRSLIAKVVQRYFADPDSRRDIEVLVSKDDAAEIEKHLMAELGAEAQKGLKVGEDNELTGGFRIAIKDEHMFHDLSEQALARLLCAFLRPLLAEITAKALKTAADSENNNKKGNSRDRHSES